MATSGTFFIPYILPMLLGRTFDANTNRVGIDIFPDEDVLNATRKDFPSFDSIHKVVTNQDQAKDFLEVSGDLSLQIKMGGLDIKGVGNYLKESTTNKHTVDILTKVKYIKETVTLMDSAEPFPDWKTKKRENLGTHYVSTISYGGMLVATIRYSSDKSEDIKSIEALVDTAMQKKDKIDATVAGQLEDINRQYNNSVQMEINYYATVPLMNVPHTIKGLMDLVSNFKEHVNAMENQKGVPIEAELTDLRNLDRSRKPFGKNADLDEPIAEMEARFDDLRLARQTLVEWVRIKPVDLPEDQEKKIGEKLESILKVLRVFYETINTLDITKGSDQLTKAEDAYYDGRIKIKNNIYETMINKFISDMDKEIKDEKDRAPASVSYTHWGHKKCNESIADTISEGVAIGSRLKGIGGPAGFHCLGPNVDTSGHSQMKNNFLSTFGGVRYDSHILGGKGVHCSLCNAGGINAATSMLGSNRCPIGWQVAYKGTVMSAPMFNFDAHAAKYICVDANPEGYSITPDPKDPFIIDTIVSANSFPGIKEDSIIPCAVCIH